MDLQPHEVNLHYSVKNDELIELDLRYTTVQDHLPNQLFHITTLKILRLNNIVDLPEDIANLQQLRVLEINRLQATTINPAITKLAQLEVLIINRSEILDLPEELSNLSHLRDVDLINNAMLELPDVLLDLPQLHYLSLAGFLMDPYELADKLLQIKHLIKLFLGKFRRPIFPMIWEGIAKITSLEYLTISGYSNLDPELGVVSPLINNLVNLKSLWIDGSIYCFPDIPDLENLEELILFGNALSSQRKKILETKEGMCIVKHACPYHSDNATT